MSSRDKDGDALYFWRIMLQIVLIIGAIACWHLPFLIPIKLMVVLLHELSHGLMALATGGEVHNLYITTHETGACQTSGGNDFLIISAGYLGSMFFGGLILTCSRSRPQIAVTCFTMACVLFWAAFKIIPDPYSKKFTMGVGAVAIGLGIFSPPIIAPLFLRTVGTISCLYALIDIYSDTLSHAAHLSGLRSDATAFSELTGVSASTVGMCWLAISAAYFFITIKTSLLVPSRSGQAQPANG